MRSFVGSVTAALVLTVAAACGTVSHSIPAASTQATRQLPARHIGPGKIVSTQDGGQIYGYDVDQHGRDGVLASAKQVGSNRFKVSVETFDTKSARITKSFAAYTGSRNSYEVDGIFANDAALVTHLVEPKKSVYAKRVYEVMNPVTAEKFTGKWTPPIKDLSVLENAENQTTTTSVVFAIELKNQDRPDLVVSDIASDSFGKIIHLDPNQFLLADSPQLAQDTVNNLAVMASSPDGGAAGGPPPNIEAINLSSGKLSEFRGIDCGDGSLGCGSPNGIAYDSATGIACTTTELDAGIEFYHVAQKSGVWEELPVPPSGVAQFYSGGYVASDPIHGLFLIAQPESGSSASGSSIQVYDESGNFVESIDGLNFTFNSDLAVLATIAIDPTTRTGWINGPAVTELQEFSY